MGAKEAKAKGYCNIAVIGSRELLDNVRDIISIIAPDKSSICYSNCESSIISLVSKPFSSDEDAVYGLCDDESTFNSLYEELYKATLTDLIASCPDVIIVDFLNDAALGCVKLNKECYITNTKALPVYASILCGLNEVTLEKTNPSGKKYSNIWRSSLDMFLDLMGSALPSAKILVDIDFKTMAASELDNRYNDDEVNRVINAEKEMIAYAASLALCDTLDIKRDLPSFLVALEANTTSAVSGNAGGDYNLLKNASFESEFAFWRNRDESFTVKDGSLLCCSTKDNSGLWHSLLSTGIRVCNRDVEWRLVFECKIEEETELSDPSIFEIDFFNSRPNGKSQCSSKICVEYNPDYERGLFQEYIATFFPRDAYVAVGPAVRHNGTVEYRNIRLVVGGDNDKSIALRERKNADYSADNNRMRTIEQVDDNSCYGCSACYAVCPKNAISMEDTRNEGFLYPVIDKSACIECEKCVKVCPAINRYAGRTVNGEAYIVRTDPSIAEASSTSGVFMILAEYALSLNGYVCGAVFDGDFNVHHIVSNSRSDILNMRRSKYVQSDCSAAFEPTRDLLDKGVYVLFTGTPCQIAALMLFLGRDYKNLLTMDLVCHGVPSPGMWRKYLDENYDVSHIKDINFRYRGGEKYNATQYLKVDFDDGRKRIANSYADYYYRFFHSDIGLRLSCGKCQYAAKPRSGDISVGDWWAAPKLRPDLVAGKKPEKISVVLVNSAKARKVLDSNEARFTLIEGVSARDALASNRKAIKRRLSERRDAFFDLVNEGCSFNEAMQQCIAPSKYDVLLDGSVFNYNYGAILTNYALYQCVKDLGYRAAYTAAPFNDKSEHVAAFVNRYIETAPTKRRENFYLYNWDTDTFLLGSDQLWNYKLFKNSSFFFDYVAEDKKRIAYATSYGFDYLTVYDGFQDAYPHLNKNMRRFDYVSVRESNGVDVGNREFFVQSTQVLDPVFLVDVDQYRAIAKNAVQVTNEPYLTSYFLSSSEQSNKLLKFASDKLNLPMVNMLTGHPERIERQREISVQPTCENLSVEEWLNNIDRSSFVVTGSFHALCFAIIFRKNFIVMQRDWAVTRMESLLDALGLRDRLVGSFEEAVSKEHLFEEAIDYDEVYRRLDAMRSESIGWLKNALQGEKRVSVVRQSVDCEHHSSFKSVTTVDAYIDLFKRKAEDCMLVACVHDEYSRNDDIALLLAMGASAGTGKLGVNPKGIKQLSSSSCLSEGSGTIIARGTGKKNERVVNAEFNEAGLNAVRSAHSVFTISFDWKTDSPSGSFKLQLAGSPWDNLCEEIAIDPTKQRGHYESIYASSDGVGRYAGGKIQLRMDNVTGNLIVYNLKIECGNRPSKSHTAEFYLSCDPGFSNMNGFACIVDSEKGILGFSDTSLGRVEHRSDKALVVIDYQNQGFRGVDSVSEIYIEDDGGRRIYPLEERGLHLLLLKKSDFSLVDWAYSAEGADDPKLLHR